MKLLLVILLISILFLLFKLFKTLKINLSVTLICSLIIVQIILAPNICIQYTISGAKLFFNAIFPSLFPFLVVINIIIGYDGIHIYSKLLGNLICRPLKLPKECNFALLVSVLCGYPLGARYTCDLYEKNIIDLNSCERLLNIASNASPLFILGSVGTAMMFNPKLGYILLLSNILSCIFMGLIIPSKDYAFKIKYRGSNFSKAESSSLNIGIILKNSIEDAIKNTLSIGGFIVIFSVITGIIKDNVIFNIVINKLSLIIGASSNFIEGILLGMLEMTNGCYLISSSHSNLYVKLAVLSFLIAFSGLSIISQVYSYTYKYTVSIKKYITRKFFQGIISSILTIILYYIFLNISSIFTFNNMSLYKNCDLYLIILIILIIPSLLITIIKLFHTS
ncbi:sporulation integral membrane protein YlbJ [Clostridium estertheticum]|uniref:Sporulation integral membrane protein YlbJ n=2 Tax=Clostridium estertheticum TaxID=238834 RepID=A0A1J0GJ62_9CLOT|nr:sporulation integral membrane protein YlbJ [Clostridium estertheticum]APC40958.1 sporulation integral membrane protein YlbJ [Clostridium estertheticum subsp. estertheticum]MBU3074021.1 sporulation integral membrane protein YlbJ [Clostridium estertheticum]MBU3164115.1 sporulation integral membrane protein YlbJ [Clostridium estertheticum]MBU3170051.1 sporulation integral membrane protein YlbJ [Clostridium estertheticum]MBZ9617174.1 sporulation integral membrane protein YlbJ [Clostridium ester